MAGRGRSKEPPRTGMTRVGGHLRLAGGWVSRRRRRQAGDGMACSRGQGTAELGFPRPAPRAALARPSRIRASSTSPVPAAGDSPAGRCSPRIKSTGQVVVADALPGQAAGLADGGIEVDGQGSVAGSRPSLPGPGQQLPDHPVQLADMAPAEAAQKGAQGGWRLDYTANGASRTAAAQRVGVDAVAAGQGGGHQGHQLVAGVGPAGSVAQVQVAVNQLGQTQVMHQGDRQEQTGVCHQAVIVKGDPDAVRMLAW